MKKLIMFAACVVFAAMTQAASVGWSVATGSTSYANDVYQIFVIGQNGVSSIATITALLDAGSDTSSYAFGNGQLAANGSQTVTAASSGKTLGAGTYEAFVILFDSASPASASDNYVILSGQANLTKTIAATTANVVFATGSVADVVNNADNWKSFGPSSGGVPEPTSGLLLLVGAGMLALRRKQK